MTASKLDDVKFSMNPQPRCPCVVLVDISGSMDGAPIAELNSGLRELQMALQEDDLARKRVEVAVVTFHDVVDVAVPFTTADQFAAPTLTTGGATHLAAGLNVALDLIETEKAKYKQQGVEYYRPWIILITDGAPTEPDQFVATTAARLKKAEEDKKVVAFAVGVEGADMARLATIVEGPKMLRGLAFRELFRWVSASMQQVSRSKPGEMTALPPAGKWEKV